MESRDCELCKGQASVYCASDAAFLCWACDSRVHQANFLVARHVRRTICRHCKRLSGPDLSGAGFLPVQPLCRSCSTEGEESILTSSDCISSTESAAASEKRKKSRRNRSRTFRLARRFVRVDSGKARVEGILVIWARSIGLRCASCVRLASHAFWVGRREFTFLPVRVGLASALWLAANLCEPRGVNTRHLRRLEECSRVPKKLILLAESKLSRVVNIGESSPADEEEGSAECSNG